MARNKALTAVGSLLLAASLVAGAEAAPATAADAGPLTPSQQGRMTAWLARSGASGEQIAAAVRNPSLALAVDKVEVVTVAVPRPTPLLTNVACRDWGKRAVLKNSFGGTLAWHQMTTWWCWTRSMQIGTGSQSWVSQDTPGVCWGYDGAAPGVNRMGYNRAWWFRKRGSVFSCGWKWFSQHKTLYVAAQMYPGGGISWSVS